MMLTREWSEMIKKNRLYFETEGGDPNKTSDDTEKTEKERQGIEQQKLDLDIKKADFQKQQADTSEREADQRDVEKEKSDKEGEGEQAKSEPEVKSNISFKTQGQYYRDSHPHLRNVILHSGEILDDDERHFVALAVQASEGRFDKEFVKYLSKGHAGNVYGKDFSAEDINSIIKYVKENDIVR